jgi:hypothetical protein
MPTQKLRRGSANRSTGPRTANGKANSRLNARRHGLASKLAIAGLTQEHVALAAAIVASDADDETYRAAHIIADCEITLRTIRQLKLEVFNDKRRGFFDLAPHESDIVNKMQQVLTEARAARGTADAAIVQLVEKVVQEVTTSTRSLYANVRRRRDLQPISLIAVEDLRRLERYERAVIRRRRRALFSLMYYNSAHT